MTMLTALCRLLSGVVRSSCCQCVSESTQISFPAFRPIYKEFNCRPVAPTILTTIARA